MSEAGTLAIDERLDELGRPEFWRAHFPTLNLNTRLAQGNLPQIEPTAADIALWRARVAEEGYLRGGSEAVTELALRLGDAVRTCKRLDIPPAFILLFDETWELFFALDPMLKAMLGQNYKILPAFWTWHVEPSTAESGWRPHRDRGRMALTADGGPAAMSVWIPLSEAIPDNGCMYILPANADPTYGTEQEATWQIDIAKVRALPARPGEFLAWNQAVLHWGGQASRFAAAPRISMALEFQIGERAPFDGPLIEPFANLGFDERLRLVAKQILQYKHMYPLTPRFAALAQRLLGLEAAAG